MFLKDFIFTACFLLSTASFSTAQTAAQVYNGGFKDTEGSILIRVGTGGAGQSGILKALADEFIIQHVENGSQPFRIAWYQSDTFVSIQYIRTGIVDVAVTYKEVAEDIAVEQGYALASYYAWRDHFLLVGPTSNPANVNASADVSRQFRQIYVAGENTTTSASPVKFLSRFDKSATNAKESLLWNQLSQTP